MFIFYLISFHYIRSDYVSIDLILFDLPDFWLGMTEYAGFSGTWMGVFFCKVQLEEGMIPNARATPMEIKAGKYRE